MKDRREAGPCAGARPGAAWWVVMAAALMIAGCGGNEGVVRPAQAPEAGGFPVVLVDARGKEVRVERRPERILSMAPTVTEILFALGLGDRVVAVTDQCNYPPEAAALPKVGKWFTPSTERALAVEPDLVVSSRGNPPAFLESLERAGCPVFSIDPKTLEDIYEAIRAVARIAGEPQAGEGLIGEMQDRLAAVEARVGGVPEEQRPTAFIVLQLAPLWTAGSGTFQDDAIRVAGGRNIAAGRGGFAGFGTESLLAADPDFLVLSTMEGDPDRMRREVLADSSLRRLSAVRGGRVLVLEADPVMRPGPRIVEAVEAMARGFYPQRFGGSQGASSSATSAR